MAVDSDIIQCLFLLNVCVFWKSTCCS